RRQRVVEEQLPRVKGLVVQEYLHVDVDRPPHVPTRIDRLERGAPSVPVLCTPRRNVPEAPATPEYAPKALACQMSTTAPWIGLHVVAFTTVRRSCNGRPSDPSVM